MSEQEVDRRVTMRHKLSNPSYEIFMGLLSILSIVNLVLMIFTRDQDLTDILVLINIVLTVFFALDFIFRFLTAPSKRYYFFRDYGWADLLSSLPFAQTNILRLFRLIRVYRLMREYGTKALGRALIKDRADSALFSLVFIAILVLEFGGLSMLKVESASPDANIVTASDSLWFMVVTMATVGYGDQYPVTNAGRVLGVIVILVGVGIFGTLTGYLANFFLSPSRSKAREDEPDVRARLAALKELNAQQARAIAELEVLLQDPPERPARPTTPPTA